MSKVRGFDVEKVTVCSNLGEVGVTHYLVGKRELVKVVSLAELERRCKKKIKKAIDRDRVSSGVEEYDSGVENGIKEACNDILVWARGRAGEEK